MWILNEREMVGLGSLIDGGRLCPGVNDRLGALAQLLLGLLADGHRRGLGTATTQLPRHYRNPEDSRRPEKIPSSFALAQLIPVDPLNSRRLDQADGS